MAVRSIENSWQLRHIAALRSPQPGGETVITALLAGIETAIDNYPHSFPDGVASEAFGQLLEGARTLLNIELGRLDGGTLDAAICGLAERVCWDLDLSVIAWECFAEHDDDDDDESEGE